MTEAKKRKKGGGKLVRSEIVTVRLDPRLRYLSDLAARSQRRTLSSYIEWTLQQSLNDAVLYDLGTKNPVTVSGFSEILWDVDPVMRLLNLARNFVHLLNFEEQLLYKLIVATDWFWGGAPDPNMVVVDSSLTDIPRSLTDIKLYRVHQSWDAIESRAKNDISQDEFDREIKNLQELDNG